MDKVLLLIFAVGPLAQSGDSANIRKSMTEINLAALEYSHSQYNDSENGYSSRFEMNRTDHNSTYDLGSEDNSTEYSYSTEVITIPQNMTCIRRDYDDDVSAIFIGEAGDIDTANIVFNSTYDFVMQGLIYNASQYLELDYLNETVVDCDVYFGYRAPLRRNLGRLTSYSLAG